MVDRLSPGGAHPWGSQAQQSEDVLAAPRPRGSASVPIATLPTDAVHPAVPRQECALLSGLLGVGVAVDYNRPGWADEVRAALGERPLTIVFDGVGGAIGTAALGLLGHGGQFVVHGWSSGAPTELSAAELARRSITVRRLQRPTDLRPLETRALEAAADGRWVPVVGRRFPLREAAQAHRAIEARATVAKTVLRPGPD